jgi:hypothetical protein
VKGVIFNLLESVVVSEHGPDVWDALLERSGASGSYSALGSYPDTELLAIVEAASATTGASVPDLLRWFGERAIPRLRARYPDFFTGHTRTDAFLRSLNDVIHAEVRKLYPGAEVPEFDFDTSERGEFVLIYRSSKQLCALAEGMLVGAAASFGERATIEQIRCMLRGDDACRFVCGLVPTTPHA